MTTRSMRKRKRSGDLGNNSSPTGRKREPEVPLSEEELLLKERQIWDAFREEHFEAIEQLPLSLHRQFTLLRELDEQSQDCQTKLLPLIEDYIASRRLIVVKFHRDQQRPSPNDPNEPTTAETNSSFQDANGGTKLPREFLTQIAWLSEELLRASEEKVNLAQAACDSVDRHIKLVDQAIKEAEKSTAQGGISNGLTPVVVPDLPATPRQAWRRNAAHANQTPAPAEADAGSSPRRGGHTGEVNTPRRGRKGDANANGEETRYCYCNEISRGVMIGCDGKKCEREWFHQDCLGMTKVPKTAWFCRDCEALRRREQKKKKGGER